MLRAPVRRPPPAPCGCWQAIISSNVTCKCFREQQSVTGAHLPAHPKALIRPRKTRQRGHGQVLIGDIPCRSVQR